jgi:class 3 adenylate cyclase
MDVAGWLCTLGLEQYEALFRQNDIDAEVLPSLGADDLRELGISSLGHRKKLLAAIAALADTSTVITTSEKVQDGPSLASSSAERRQVTVMFSDLVGSTALSARMDPEDLREVISAYQKCVAEAVRRFGGYVASARSNCEDRLILTDCGGRVEGFAVPRIWGVAAVFGRAALRTFDEPAKRKAPSRNIGPFRQFFATFSCALQDFRPSQPQAVIGP